MPSLTPAEQKVAAYFLQHYDSLQDTPISVVASASQVAKSAVVRLCKRLGLKGYKDFLQALRVEQSGGVPLGEVGASFAAHGDSLERQCAQIVEGGMHALRDTLVAVDFALLRHAGAVLRDAWAIEIHAAGGAMAAEMLAGRLRRTGLRAYALPEKQGGGRDAAAPDADMAFLLLCAGGVSAELIALAEAAREAGAAVIALVETGDDALRPLADVLLTYGRQRGHGAFPLPLYGLVEMLLAAVRDG